MTYAKKIIQQLRGQHVRVHTMLVIGGRDLDAGNVSARLHNKGP